MRLTKNEQDICNKHRRSDGLMDEGCYECPLMVAPETCRCKLNSERWGRWDQKKVDKRIQVLLEEEE